MTYIDQVRLAGSRGRLSVHAAVDPVTAEVWVRGKHIVVNGKELPEQHVLVHLSDLKFPSSDYSALPEFKVEPPPSGATAGG